MQSETAYISTKQLILLTAFMNLCTVILTAPILLLKFAERSALTVLIIYVLFDIAQIAVFLLCDKLSKGKTFYELIERFIGKIATKIVMIVLMCYSLLKIMLFLLFIKNFICTGLFEGIKWEFFLVPLVLLLVSFSLSSIRSLGRTSEMFFIFITIAGVLLIFFISEGLDLTRLLPLSDKSEEIPGAILRFPMWFGNYFVSILYLGRVKRTKRFKTAMSITLAVSAVIIIIVSAIIFSSYIDVMHILDFNKKTSSVAQTNVSRLNAGRLDLVFFCVQLIAIIILAGQYFYFTARSGEYLLGISRPSRAVCFSLGLAVFILSVWLFYADGISMYLFTKVFNIAVLSVQAALPLFTLAAALYSKKRRSETNETHTQEKAADI